jgi:hypothetical protein
MPTTLMARFPEFSLLGDGTVVTVGPVAEIYPGQALPNLQARTLTEEGIQAILRAARDAGLLGPDRHYTTMLVSDVPTTVFTVFAGGDRRVISVYGLGMEDRGQGMPQDEVEARQKLEAFEQNVLGLDSWLPPGSLTSEHPYNASALRVFVQQPYQSPDPTLVEPPVDWPLAGSLADFGQPYTGLQGTRCGTVEGEEAARVLEAAKGGNELTPWQSGGKEYGLLFRPLLPYEHGCAGAEPAA